MARKVMTKEVTRTIAKVVKMVVNGEGLPVAEPVGTVELIGNVSIEKANKDVQKEYGADHSVYAVEANTDKYKMEVSEFIKHATLVTEEADTEDEEEV